MNKDQIVHFLNWLYDKQEEADDWGADEGEIAEAYLQEFSRLQSTSHELPRDLPEKQIIAYAEESRWKDAINYEQGLANAMGLRLETIRYYNPNAIIASSAVALDAMKAVVKLAVELTVYHCAEQIVPDGNPMVAKAKILRDKKILIERLTK